VHKNNNKSVQTLASNALLVQCLHGYNELSAIILAAGCVITP